MLLSPPSARKAVMDSEADAAFNVESGGIGEKSGGAGAFGGGDGTKSVMHGAFFIGRRGKKRRR